MLEIGSSTTPALEIGSSTIPVLETGCRHNPIDKCNAICMSVTSPSRWHLDMDIWVNASGGRSRLEALECRTCLER